MAEKNPDEFNGWVNRESWATALWLDNEFETYEKVSNMAKAAFRKGRKNPDSAKFALAKELKEYVEELNDIRKRGYISPEREEMLENMFDDIGSLWRVDWVEVAEHYLEELEFDAKMKEKARGKKEVR